MMKIHIVRVILGVIVVALATILYNLGHVVYMYPKVVGQVVAVLFGFAAATYLVGLYALAILYRFLDKVEGRKTHDRS